MYTVIIMSKSKYTYRQYVTLHYKHDLYDMNNISFYHMFICFMVFCTINRDKMVFFIQGVLFHLLIDIFFAVEKIIWKTCHRHFQVCFHTWARHELKVTFFILIHQILYTHTYTYINLPFMLYI